MLEPQISVLVATRNRADYLRDLLPQLEAARLQVPVAVEIVVIDNGSGDDTPEVLSAWSDLASGRRRLSEPQPGKSRALNHALLEARGMLLVFTDDDVSVPPGWLRAVWQFFAAHPEFAAAMGRVRVPPDTEPDLLRRIRRLPITQPLFDLGDAVCDAPEIYGCNMAVRRATFDAVGGFDERLGPAETGACEDTELGARIQRAGMRLGYMPEALLYHRVDPSRISVEAFREFHRRLARSLYILDARKANLGCAAKWLESAFWRLVWLVLRRRADEVKSWGRMIRHAELLRIHLGATRTRTNNG